MKQSGASSTKQEEADMPAKYLKIANKLQEDIFQGLYNETGFLPTELEIAASNNVSRQTARNALAVLVSNGLIERRQGSGSRIVKQKKNSKSNSVAVVTTYINDYIFPNVLKDIQHSLSKKNYAVYVYATQNRVDEERKILQKLLQLNIDGLIMEGSKTALPSPNLDLYQQFEQRDIPIIFIYGNYPALSDHISITDDNIGGGYQLTNYLINKGHTDIAGIFKVDDLQGHGRYSGYLKALTEANLRFSDDNILWFDTVSRERLLRNENNFLEGFVKTVVPKCSAVVCHNDEIAYHLIQLLMQNGINVPNDIAIVSFDNSQLSDLSPIKITSLAHGTRRVGQKAAMQLLNLIDKKEVLSEIVSWTLVEKETS